jgi:hypothetical protein
MNTKVLFCLIIIFSFNSLLFSQSKLIRPNNLINPKSQNFNLQGYWQNNYELNQSAKENQTNCNLDSIYMITLGGTSSKVQFFYNEQNKLTSYVCSYWDGNRWIVDWRVTNSYNSDGKIKTYLWEWFSNNLWVPVTRQSYDYNSFGQETSFLIEDWNGSQWTNGIMNTEQYDSTGNLIEEISETWADTSWKYSNRITNTYFENGIVASGLIETWNNNNWIFDHKSNFEYDNNWNLINSIVKQWNGREWLKYLRGSFYYDMNNNRTEETTEIWTDSTWIYYERILNENNEDNCKVHSKYYMWDNGVWHPTNGPIVFTLPEGTTMGFITSEITFFYSPLTSITQKKKSTEKGFSLFQNFPNPFNAGTIIRYQIPSAGFVSLKIYDLLGNEVAVLVNEYKQPGNYEIEFNIRRGEITSSLPSGIYFYQIRADNFIETRKLVLMK